MEGFEMATFHFTIKSDKKPDGGQVKALDHVEYINRQGAYSENELERRKEKRSINNIITSSKKSNAYNGAEALLYTSQYGEIYNTPDGIQVKFNPSIDTISIALMVANETLNAPLVIKGSKKFKQKCIDAAAEASLDINFADRKLQDELLKRKEELNNGRKKFEQNGGRIVYPRSIHKPSFAGNKRKVSVTLAKAGTLMSELSQRNMAGNLGKTQSENDTMLLQVDNDVQLDNGRFIRYPLVRRSFSRGRKSRAIKTAKQIVKNIERNLDEVFASSHVEYINREKAFAKRGGCIYHSHRLPKWADDNPVKFFKAADRYEGVKNCRYKEIEFALPNELNLEQNLEIIQRFLDEHLSNHYYAYAVHDKIGAMTSGIHNTHVHIMFSERIIDECEQEKERTAKAYFSYPKRNAKNNDEKRMGGAPKDDKFTRKDRAKYTVEMRASYAEIVNETLEKYGFTDRIDHRSLKAQRQEAIMNGDTFLAKLLDRIPEKHINPIVFEQESNPKVESLKLYRAKKQELQNLLFEADQAEKSQREEQLLLKSKAVQDKTETLINTLEYEESVKSTDEIIVELRDNLLEAMKEYRKWQDTIITKDQAERIAKIEMMNEDERELWGHYQNLITQESHWKEFLSDIKSSENYDAMNNDYLQLVQEIEKRLNQLSSELSDNELQSEIVKLELSFDKPDKRALLQRKIAKILFENKHAKEKFSHASDNLASATETLRQVLFEETIQGNKKQIYTTKELYEIARKRYFGLKKELQRLRQRLEKEEKKVISPERAVYMAKDVLTKGGLRRLREQMRDYNKRLKRYETKLSEFGTNRANLTTEEVYTMSLQFDIERKTLENLKKQHENDYNQLIATLKPNKITDVANGILKKNKPQAEAVEKLHKDLVIVERKFEEAKKHMNAMRELMDNNHNAEYKVTKDTPPVGSGYIPDYNKASMIMDALCGRDELIPNVQVRFNDDDYGMKNWMLMSELAKEEEMRKRWKRNL